MAKTKPADTGSKSVAVTSAAGGRRFHGSLLGILIAIIVIIGAVIYANNHGTNSSGSSGTNCGLAKSVETATDLKPASPFKGCFDSHFASCSPANIDVSNELQLAPKTTPTKLTEIKYQIISNQGHDCLVRWQYTYMSLIPSYQNKTITCPYNSSKEFQAALAANANYTGCSGPLLSVIKNTKPGSAL